MSAKTRRSSVKPGRRQLAWLNALEQVGANIDGASYARIARYLRRNGAQEVKRYYYIDLRGARGIAKVEATLKGG